MRGGARTGAGRPIGSRNKRTIAHLATLEELARTHTETALGALVSIAESGESESARVAAANALLDRAYGRPKQAEPVNPVPAPETEPTTDNPHLSAKVLAFKSRRAG